MAANATIGALRVSLGIDSAAFSDGLKKSQKNLDDFGKKVAVGAAAVAAAATAMGTALAVSIKKTIDQADELSKAAQKFGVATDELSKLKHAADLSGVSLDGLGAGLRKLSQNMLATASGASNDAAAAFQAMGIAVQNTDGSLRSSTDIMAQVADRFGGMKDGAEKTALAMAVFGRSGTDLIPMLNAGAAGLNDMMQEAERLGIVIDTDTGKRAELFNDTLTRMGRVWDGLVTKLASNLLPALQLMADKFLAFVNNEGAVTTAANTISGAFLWIAKQAAHLVLLVDRVRVEIEGVIEAARRFNNYDFSGAWEAFTAGQEASAKMRDELNGMFAEFESAISNSGLPAAAATTFGDIGTAAGESFVTKLGDAAASSSAAESMALRMQEGVTAFQNSLLTESEAERNEYANRLIELQGFLDAKLISRQEFNEMDAALAAEHRDRMTEIALSQAEMERASRDRALGDLSRTMSSIGSILESQGGKNLEISKAFAVAGALLNTYLGASQVLGDPTIPTFEKFAAVAAIVATGLSQVASIRSVSRGGGGGQKVSSGAMVNGGERAAAPQQAVSITLNGDSHSTQSVYDLMEQINAASADGHKLIVRKG